MRIPTEPHRPALHIEIRRRNGVRNVRHGIVITQSAPERNGRLYLKPDEARRLADALHDTVELDLSERSGGPVE